MFHGYRQSFFCQLPKSLGRPLLEFPPNSHFKPKSPHVCKYTHPLCSTPNIDKLPDPTTSPCLSPPTTTDRADPPVQSTTLSPRRSAATSSIFPKG